ncbi:hypothetical protein ACFP1Z_30780 [Streptomyces gamaensis]|uniref:Uncharacterized protein n=1 Tax=Streptomyces gamaensis TaxID=1763542 RepID=A0ABW0ZC65_9ACTN
MKLTELSVRKIILPGPQGRVYHPKGRVVNQVRAGAACVLGGMAMQYAFEAAALAVVATSAFDDDSGLDLVLPGVLVLLALLGFAVKLIGAVLLGKETLRTIRSKGWKTAPRELWQIARTGSSRPGKPWISTGPTSAKEEK